MSSTEPLDAELTRLLDRAWAIASTFRLATKVAESDGLYVSWRTSHPRYETLLVGHPAVAQDVIGYGVTPDTQVRLFGIPVTPTETRDPHLLELVIRDTPN